MYTPELIARMYKKMSLIRRFELRLAEIYHTDAIKSPVHLSVGQESIAVGICGPLEKSDIFSNTYRCHATYVAKGGDLNLMMAHMGFVFTTCLVKGRGQRWEPAADAKTEIDAFKGLF